MSNTPNKLREFMLKYDSICDDDFLINQGIVGYLDKNSKDHKLQCYKNNLLLKEYHFIKKEFKNERCVLLKGPALLSLNVYEDYGDRSIGDLDLLVLSLDQSSQLLLKLGYQNVSANHWEANHNKLVFSRFVAGVELIVELHDALFSHDRKDKDIETMMIGEVQILSYNHFLVHLVGHLGYMHTFIKIHWLIDIYLFIKKFKDKLEIEFITSELKRLGFLNSWRYSMYYIEQIFEEKLFSYDQLSSFEKYFLDSQFILYPEKRKINYYVVKHLVKDRFIDSLRYDFQWLINKGWKL